VVIKSSVNLKSLSDSILDDINVACSLTDADDDYKNLMQFSYLSYVDLFSNLYEDKDVDINQTLTLDEDGLTQELSFYRKGKQINIDEIGNLIDETNNAVMRYFESTGVITKNER
jgi:hypothetical protein